ncbi:hypothetical protein M758_7G150500 [Ceratodon purpureus]|nr:hypothetical protein M758_7G150500 [Ceratodon purpureus]
MFVLLLWLGFHASEKSPQTSQERFQYDQLVVCTMNVLSGN